MTEPETPPQPGPPSDAARVVTPHHPIDRWLARVWLDYAFFGFLFTIGVAIVAPHSPLLQHGYALTWLSAFWWIPIEAVLISRFGTTPGKSLVGIHVTREDGSRLSLPDSFSRAVSAWAVGCVLMIPLASIVGFVIQYRRLRRGEDSWWDARGGYVVNHTPLSRTRRVVLFLIVLTVVAFATFAAVAERATTYAP